jgi:hypothetical protein
LEAPVVMEDSMGAAYNGRVVDRQTHLFNARPEALQSLRSMTAAAGPD